LLENADIASGKKPIVLTQTRKTEDGKIIGDDVAQFVYEPSSVNKALELLGKHLGMFTNKVDVTTDGKELPTVINVTFSDEPA
ncbi:MAG: terminase small subunit, partial [Aggregatibacter sp.]